MTFRNTSLLAAALLLIASGCVRRIGDHYIREYAGPHGVSVRTSDERTEVDAPHTRVRVNYGAASSAAPTESPPSDRPERETPPSAVP